MRWLLPRCGSPRSFCWRSSSRGPTSSKRPRRRPAARRDPDRPLRQHGPQGGPGAAHRAGDRRGPPDRRGPGGEDTDRSRLLRRRPRPLDGVSAGEAGTEETAGKPTAGETATRRRSSWRTSPLPVRRTTPPTTKRGDQLGPDLAVRVAATEQELHLFTDLQRSGLDWAEVDPLPQTVQVHLHDLGRAVVSNLAVTEARPIRGVVRPGEPTTIQSTVLNSTPFPVAEQQVLLKLESPAGKLSLRERVKLEPGSTGSASSRSRLSTRACGPEPSRSRRTTISGSTTRGRSRSSPSDRAASSSPTAPLDLPAPQRDLFPRHLAPPRPGRRRVFRVPLRPGRGPAPAG